jgi:hypothetical protein
MITTFFSHWKKFGYIGLDLDSDPELDPDQHSSKSLDPDPHIMNADPKHWCAVSIAPWAVV